MCTMKPVIGIIVCGLMDDRQFVTNAYIQSIKYAKGVPLLLPLVRSDEALQTYCSLCDGFLFCGGNDITPLLFGKEPAKGLGTTNITLDIFQLRLLRAILKTKKPLLAICRGMQVLNVACGGTLLQDIDTSLHAPINHMQLSTSRSEISHKVLVAKGSILSSITGSSLYTNSFHHQAVDSLGKGLVPTARTSDGIIEAIELSAHPFALGVQWHPECMYRTSPVMRDLFASFITACRK